MRCGFDPWVEKILWSRKWQPSPVFLPEKSYGQRNLVGYSPWGQRESDTTEHTHTPMGDSITVMESMGFGIITSGSESWLYH